MATQPPKLDGIELIEAIDLALINSAKANIPREYIGGSTIGHECDAYLALSLRGFPDNAIDPQLMRIFELGHIIEDVIVKHVKASGYFKVLYEVDPMTNEQWEFKSHGGHAISHFDGIAITHYGESVVFEAKSMNKAKFEQFKSLGVRFSHPMYYFQCQGYMSLSNTNRALVIAYCKDNSAMHSEFIELEPEYKYWIEARVDSVVAGEAERISQDEIDFRCKGCFKRDACWGKKHPVRRCSTCQFARPDLSKDDQQWFCDKHSKACSDPCSDYQAYQPKERN